MRIFTGRLRSALLATVVAALTVFGLGLVPAPARADWVRNDQWHLGALNAVAAWQHGTGSGVLVAVLDSGVDGSHPDLAGQVLAGIDLVDGSSDGRFDPVGHGTTVASLIAGRRDEAGVVGMAPDAKILPVRVLDRQNRYEDASIVARGLRWAVDRGARVINLSLGGLAYSDVLAGALAYAASHDVVIVACTGNLTQGTGGPEIWYPAREPGVVAVAGLSAPASSTNTGWLDRPMSMTGVEELWTGSLTGPQTVLSAPAVNLLGARPGGYWRVQGTSFAAPLVAGAATLVRSRYPELSAANVINRLIRTADDLGAAGRDDRYGYGQVNPLTALAAEVGTVTDNPLTGAPEAAGQAGAAVSGDGAPGTNGAGNSADNRAPGGAPAPDSAHSVGFGARDKPSTSDMINTASTASLLAVALLLALAAAGSQAGHRQYLLRYLRRARHSK